MIKDMKVKELIKELQKANPEAIVVLSRDEEGNGYSPLADINTENQKFSEGEIGFKELTSELQKQRYSEEDLLEGEDCVVLWP